MDSVQAIQIWLEVIFAFLWAAPSRRNEVQYLPKEIRVDKNLILVIQGYVVSRGLEWKDSCEILWFYYGTLWTNCTDSSTELL